MMNTSFDESILKSFPDELKERGYLVVKQVIDHDLIARLRQVTDALVAKESSSQQEAVRSLGSLISTWKDPAFVELATHPAALEVLSTIGAAAPRYSNGYIFSKPPQSPAAFWHQDWWLWQHPLSYTAFPHQLGFLYYLEDTSEDRGCLRVIPGSHRKRHKFHDLVAQADRKSLRRMDQPEHELYQACKEQAAVPVEKGDLVIVDARLIHGSFPNRSSSQRTLITLWYYPFYDQFDEPTKATIEVPQFPESWPQAMRAKLASLLPSYKGGVKPLPFTLHPLPELK